MTKVLLLGTRQKGKMAEFRGILKNLNLKLLTLNDISFPQLEPEENGKTYEDNAIIKAKFYGLESGLLTLADDTGLEITLLASKLGLKTRRYAQGSDRNRCNKLLKEMKNVPWEKRTARFISTMALFNPQSDKLEISQGICWGKIAFKPRGNRGFGYDPVFIIKGLKKTFAELTLREKNKVSHRAKALKKMKKYLRNL